MGLLNELGIEDPTTLDADQVEQQLASGGLPPEGFHHAVLNGVRSVNANTGSSGYELVFVLLAPPAAGAEVKETIWLPSMSQEKAKRDKSVARVTMFGHRLGLLKKVSNGAGKGSHYVEASPGRTFTDAIGAECVIEVVHEEEEWTDKQTGKKRSMKKAKVTYAGIFAVADPQVAKVPRGKAGAVAAGSVGGGPGGGAAKDDFGDL